MCAIRLLTILAAVGKAVSYGHPDNGRVPYGRARSSFHTRTEKRHRTSPLRCPLNARPIFRGFKIVAVSALERGQIFGLFPCTRKTTSKSRMRPLERMHLPQDQLIYLSAEHWLYVFMQPLTEMPFAA